MNKKFIIKDFLDFSDENLKIISQKALNELKKREDEKKKKYFNNWVGKCFKKINSDDYFIIKYFFEFNNTFYTLYFSFYPDQNPSNIEYTYLLAEQISNNYKEIDFEVFVEKLVLFKNKTNVFIDNKIEETRKIILKS